MSKLKFIQLQKDNEDHYNLFESLMIPYNMELVAHHPNSMVNEEFIKKLTLSSLNIQGPADRHLELCFDEDELIGFLYGKVDHEDHKGHKKPGFGYIMEFYVKSEFRRKGYGKIMFERLEKLFLIDGAERMYLNTGTETGVEFWTSLGFKATDEIQPHNNMIIYEKEIFESCSNTNYKVIPATENEVIFVCMLYAENKEPLHGKDISFNEWIDILSNPDPAEENFLVLKGEIPVAWLRINGLDSDTAWVSMLVVHNKFKHQGVGSFALKYAEDYAKAKGITAMGIHTTTDNFPAQNCYKKMGYSLIEEGECTTGDGVKRRGLTFHIDHLNAVRMSIDGVNFRMGEPHDFSFIYKIGMVFRVFDAMDSGNICFGVEQDGKRYFVKFAGARTMDYKGEFVDAVDRLKAAVMVYNDLQHPYLINLVDHYQVGNGYLAIFDWVDGEGLRSYWDCVGQAMWNHPDSPNYRFRHLPLKKRIAVVDKIMDFHQYVVEKNYVPVDFYDGSMIYNFATDDFHICDIDFYRKTPTYNDMGKMWGSSRFMSPEEYQLGAALDEVSVVFILGATAFELLGGKTENAYKAWRNGTSDRSYESWSASKALFDVANKATSIERSKRYQTVAKLIEAWEAAKTIDNIQYRRLNIDDIKLNILDHFNRYQVVERDFNRHGDQYVLEENPHIENWDESRKHEVISGDFMQAIHSGGTLFGAFDGGKLIGFCAVSGKYIGNNNQYLQLKQMHVSYEYRNNGIGRKLFSMGSNSARNFGAQKLYITASSSEESQAFYRAMGCVYAEEIIPELFRTEPYDVHMEYVL